MLHALQAKAAAAESPKQPSAKKRSVIDITASAASMQLPERPGPLPGATASPLQDAKGGRRWSAAALHAADAAAAAAPGPLAAGAAANAAAESAAAAAAPTAAPAMPPLGEPPATRSAGFRAALRDIVSGGGPAQRTRGSSRAGADACCAAAAGAGGGDTPPASPTRVAAVPALAKASPHYMAPNGQPRKGAKIALPSAAGLTGAKAKRSLFDANCGSGAVAGEDSWIISSGGQTARPCA